MEREYIIVNQERDFWSGSEFVRNIKDSVTYLELETAREVADRSSYKCYIIQDYGRYDEREVCNNFNDQTGARSLVWGRHLKNDRNN